MSELSDFWVSVETIHDIVYFAPDVKERYGALGLKGYWMGYFASRAGALGEVGPEIVQATFHGFAPLMVARAVPDCWTFADRRAVLDVRLQMATAALRPTLAGHDESALAAALTPVVAGLDLAGKPLAASEAALPVPDDPTSALWRRASILREFRGDCHVAVLVAAGLGGIQANALQVACGRGPADLRLMRGWSEQEWAEAMAGLVERGWIDESGAATEEGTAVREGLENDTDRVCESFLTSASLEAARAISGSLLAAARSVAGSGVIPYPNPVGVRAP